MSTPTIEFNEILNHEDFIILWISLEDAPDEFKKRVHDLTKFDSTEAGLSHVKQIKSESKVFLVLTNSESLSTFENLPQIQSIYIFNKENGALHSNTQDHPKFIGAFGAASELINRMEKDVLLTYRSDLPITISSINEIRIEQSLTNIHENTLMFLWDELFIYYLTESSNTDMSQLIEDLVEQCNLEYAGDQRELEKIKEFHETCSSDNALEWYSKDSFLVRLFNKAFRTRNIDLMCKFRYYVILLHNEFQKLSKEQNSCPSVVYRGQLLDEKTIKKLQSNKGNIISMNTIVSTSADELVARIFIADTKKTAVIFKIHIPEQTDSGCKPFIDISELSLMKHEEEILFFIGTVFEINSVQQDNTDSIWLVELTLRNEITQRVKELISVFQLSFTKIFHHLFMKTDDFKMIEKYYNILTEKSFSSKIDPAMMIDIRFAFALSNLGQYEQAIELYKQTMLKNTISVNSPESIVIHMIIGYLYYHSEKYNDAFDCYGLVLSLLNEKTLLASELYSHIGDVWKQTDQRNTALSCYREALQIASNEDFPSSLNLYENLISILEKQGNWDDAFVYKCQADEINQTLYHIRKPAIYDQTSLEGIENELLNNHHLTPIQRADLLYQKGLCLTVTGDFDPALENLLQAKELILKEPPPWDRFPRHWSTLFDNIALIYLHRRDYLKALASWKQGVNIRCTFQNN